MKRTQLYLDDDLWNVLDIRARKEGTSISHLVRQAVRRQYLGDLDERRRAMCAFIGIRKDRKALSDKYIRSLRCDKTIERPKKK